MSGPWCIGGEADYYQPPEEWPDDERAEAEEMAEAAEREALAAWEDSR